MTSSIKNLPELGSPAKPGASSQSAENKSAESTRSNPVCLEVNVTLRSLPTEAGALTQPIREEIKTVIVFDNGAVLRSSSNLPAGLTLILSNPNARDVVCRVVTGHSMPSVKGYVEVEFIEPVKDFWGIHQEGGPVTGRISPAAMAEAQQASAPAPPVSVRSSSPVEAATKPVANVPSRSVATPESASAPTNVPPPVVKHDPKPEPATPASQARSKVTPDYDHSEASSTSVGNWTPAPPGPPPAEKPLFRAPSEASATPSSTQVAATPPPPARDFMSKGLMAYEQPSAAPSTSMARTPLIVGAAALVFAGVCGVWFYMHQSAAPASVAKAAAVNQPAASPAAATNSTPPPAQAPQQESAPVARESQSQPAAQPVAVEPIQPAAAVKPIPSAAAPVATEDTQSDARNARHEEKPAPAAKQPNVSTPPRRPVISNLKMSSPSAPSKNVGDLGDGAAPITEIASADVPAGSPPAGLLTSAGRTSGQPAPPPSALAPTTAPAAPAKTVTDPKLLSSTRPAYPATAKQSNIEGSVTVVAYIDPNGKVFSARALSGPVMLRAAAEDAVKQWKYSPGLEDGKPASSHVVVKVEFRLH
jgi:protein TonB